MAPVLDELVQLLALERIEENLFRGQSQDLGWGALFGGQVLGQALSAAVQTVDASRIVHSLHAYFLRPGDVTRPIVYHVDRSRDGGSFSTRRVVAVQRGEPLFNLAASFQRDEDGFSHQDPMPDAPAPETLATEQSRVASHADKLPRHVRAQALALRPIELRPVDPVDDAINPSPRPPTRLLWLRAIDELPEQPSLHRYLLAYASDWAFMTTSLLPHGVSWLTPGMQVTSLDHAMYFHAPFRVDDWLLHAIDSPFAGGARGLVRGRIFTRDGRLVASTVQEGLIRKRTDGR